MMFQAVLSNRDHPEYGVATIPFPIPHDQYAHCMDLLEALEIGDAVRADCKVEKIDGFYTVLKRTEMLTVNVEELNYLAKRLDGFDTGEAAQFQAMAHKLELFELKDLINLSFCCQQVTVITDFSDLDAVGRDHYMNLHGGSARVDELEALDGEETARLLIGNGSGTITPYGVVYDNGMQMKLLYDGQFFPCYYYEPNPITVAVTAMPAAFCPMPRNITLISCDLLARKLSISDELIRPSSNSPSVKIMSHFSSAAATSKSAYAFFTALKGVLFAVVF